MGAEILSFKAKRQGIEALPRFESLPLWDMVPLPEKRGVFSDDLMNTSGHELNHALVAMSISGAHVVSVSVIRDGNSLGRTVFAGSLSADAIKIIAAAGSVATHDGRARGFGGDMHTINVLSQHYGGLDKESAITIASNAISKYSTDVRRKAAEIIAHLSGTHMKEVPGSLIPSIIARAQAEVEIEQGIKSNKVVVEYDFRNVQNQKKEEPVNDYTIIENLGDKGSRIIYVIDGQIKREEFLCPLCKTINGHSESCSRRENKEISKTNFRIKDDYHKSTRYPEEVTIFSRN